MTLQNAQHAGKPGMPGKYFVYKLEAHERSVSAVCKLIERRNVARALETGSAQVRARSVAG
jgi:hypothetical protein